MKVTNHPEDRDKLLQAPLLAHARAEADPPTLLTSTYFDTPELAIHGCKASLRVRSGGPQRLQTLKLDGAVEAGVFDRDEFETPVASDTPDLALLHDAISLKRIVAR
ncbi:CYTH domain-containing protein [Paraburkholderia phymatum]|uniref:CYTH domain-containing protein n=1 Tax=Paraburkholderia phymatum TaxID=148447 RepID=UPI0000E79F86|nr:CYTH domain-containing protein [Paraburkholderia phymatum]